MVRSTTAYRIVLLAWLHQQLRCVSSFAPRLASTRETTKNSRGFSSSYSSLSSPMLLLHASTSPSSSSVTSTKESNTQQESLWESMLDRFQGDFDNYNQVVQDRKQGLLPREGGGHEHIHCCLVPVDKDTRLAAFYFDGVPGAIFRFRYYKLVPADTTNPESSTTVDTLLYTLHADLDQQLRQCSNPTEWPAIFHAFSQTDRTTILKKCDVQWSWDRDPIQHAYAATQHSEPGTAMHAVMVYGAATVASQMLPGQEILIKDQLSLWQDALWIHDRGYNPETGAFIYGNQKGVPYNLQRVADMRCSNAASTDASASADTSNADLQPQRTVMNTELAWTLGPDYRSEAEYEALMDVIGGSSRPAR